MRKAIGMFMAAAVVIVMAEMMAGCATYSYGPFTARTLASNADIKRVAWTKVVTGTNTFETMEVNGYSRDEVKGTKTVGDVIGMISGGLIGSVGGPATAIGGAIAGGGAADLLQRYLDGLKPVANIVPSVTPGTSTNPTPAVITTNSPATTSCGCDLSLPLSLPPYTDQGLNDAGNSEECPATKAGAGVVRLAVIKPGGGSWLLGHLLDNAYDIDGKGNACGKCFKADGGVYHFIGYDRNQAAGKITHVNPGEWFPYTWVTFIWFEFRKQ